MAAMENIDQKRNRLAEWLVAAGRGDEQAFAEVYGATHSYLHHVVLRMLATPAHAEEVLQEAYMAIWLQATRYQPELGSAMAWLIAVVRNHAISALRSQRVERHSVSLSDDAVNLESALMTDEDADPIRHAFNTTLRKRLPGALATLEAPQRQAIALSFQHGLAHAEISAHMNAPLGTVKSWLRRGVGRLNTHLTQPAARPAAVKPEPNTGKQRRPHRC
jgi:RNA polymerase sigma-70 factor (ECF subfamily)